MLTPQQTTGRPTAFIQVDLDGLWAVRRCYGMDGSPEDEDPVYREALPALLELFKGLDISATFFVVGADAAIKWKRETLETALRQGHELANHSMNHDLDAQPDDRQRLEVEIRDCQNALRGAFGIEARGYRAPGYGFSQPLIEALEQQGLHYDGSLLPTAWGWLMRWITRRISTSRRPGRSPFGSLGGSRFPLRPFPTASLASANGNPQSAIRKDTFWEVPVSVTRRARLPFHGGIGYLLGQRWVGRAVKDLARHVGFLNYVIHGMDLVDGRRWAAAAGRANRWFFAGDARKRLAFFKTICLVIQERFEIVRTDRWVESVRT